MSEQSILFFDGVCGLCNRTVDAAAVSPNLWPFGQTVIEMAERRRLTFVRQKHTPEEQRSLPRRLASTEPLRHSLRPQATPVSFVICFASFRSRRRSVEPFREPTPGRDRTQL